VGIHNGHTVISSRQPVAQFSHNSLLLLVQALVLRCFNRGDRLTFHELRYVDHVSHYVSC
jgi:hypothetical protein